MYGLVSQVRKTLFSKDNVGIKLPKYLGILIGYLFDIITKITGKSLPVSSIRVRKFMGTTQFDSSISQTGFIPPISIQEGLLSTIQYEFINDNTDKQTFETE